jgi:hypothetical protein
MSSAAPLWLIYLNSSYKPNDASTASDRHTALIREFLGVTAYGPAAREVVVETCLQAARTRDDLPDLNGDLRHKMPLPFGNRDRGL